MDMQLCLRHMQVTSTKYCCPAAPLYDAGTLELQSLPDFPSDMTGPFINVELCASVQVCGPPPLMKSISGDKAEDKSQGPLTGILKDLGYTSEQVYKF